MIRYENQISGIQACIMSISVRRNTEEERRRSKQEEETGRRKVSECVELRRIIKRSFLDYRSIVSCKHFFKKQTNKKQLPEFQDGYLL